MPTQRRRQKPDRKPALAVLPMQLRVGDQFMDEEGEWEVVGRPSTASGGKTAQALVRRLGEPASERPMIWPAHEKLTIWRVG